ncbi:hypothetical protein NDU88_000744 [Pleurodeles waltl]|uniref:Uncharacterized protein n=1 Tax=Pleurodeles waltl TaxID=8319 RepID=A0AAV7RAW7_PLEWA|nr:hypothetical protein NDU88_000744 [Pleurodeles waltl]
MFLDTQTWFPPSIHSTTTRASRPSTAYGRTDPSTSGRTDLSTSGRTDLSISGRTDLSTSGRTDLSTSGRTDTDLSTSGRTDLSTCGRTGLSTALARAGSQPPLDAQTCPQHSHELALHRLWTHRPIHSTRTSWLSAAYGRTDLSTSGRTDLSTSGRTDLSISGRTDLSTSGRTDTDLSTSGRTDLSTSGRTDTDLSTSGRTDLSRALARAGSPLPMDAQNCPPLDAQTCPPLDAQACPPLDAQTCPLHSHEPALGPLEYLYFWKCVERITPKSVKALAERRPDPSIREGRKARVSPACKCSTGGYTRSVSV